MSPSNSMQPPEHLSIRIDGFEPSWAGANPFDKGFAIGSEDGMIAFTDEAGNVIEKPQAIAPSREAINGIAGFDRYLAVSTRQDLTVLTLPEQTDQQAPFTTFQRGAHGVLATSTRRFVAPLGHAGLMIVDPGDCSPASLREYPVSDRDINLYQLHEMPSAAGRNWLVGACRARGVGIIDYALEKNELGFQSCTFPEIDVVDVVSVGTPAYPHAVVAVGIGGEVLLFRDLVHHEPPISLKYTHFAGKTYRVLSACGHLFVLTGKAIYVLGNLADRLRQPTLGEHGHPMMTIPMEATDANICGNRWLLAVMSDAVHRYDIHQINERLAEVAPNGQAATTPLPHSRLNWRDWQTGNGDRRWLHPAAGEMEPVAR